MEPMAKLFLAYLLLDLFRAAEFHSRRSLGFLASHARSNPFVNQHLEVRANLPVKVFLYTPGEKEISEKTFGLCKQRHAPPQEHHGASKACAMAQEMRPHRLDSASSCFLPALVRRQYFARRWFSESPQKEDVQPSSSIRCRAGNSDPGLTTKVPPVICWILREMPKPCISPVASDFKISRSNVPCSRVVGSECNRNLLSKV